MLVRTDSSSNDTSVCLPLAELYHRDQVGRSWEVVSYPAKRLLVVLCWLFFSRVGRISLDVLVSTLLYHG